MNGNPCILHYEMSERLKDMVETYLIRAGKNGAFKLASEANVSVRLVYNVKNEGHVPKPEIAHRLAKACGATEEDALRIAKGCSSEAKRAG